MFIEVLTTDFWVSFFIHSSSAIWEQCRKTLFINSFDARNLLLDHINSDHAKDGDILKCYMCDNMYARTVHLEKHLFEKHGCENKAECPECRKVFSNQKAMKRHLEVVHTSNQQFKCHLCDKRFNAKSYLRAHLKTHPGFKPFQCQICNREFSQRIMYTKHLEGHELKIR